MGIHCVTFQLIIWKINHVGGGERCKSCADNVPPPRFPSGQYCQQYQWGSEKWVKILLPEGCKRAQMREREGEREGRGRGREGWEREKEGGREAEREREREGEIEIERGREGERDIFPRCSVTNTPLTLLLSPGSYGLLSIKDNVKIWGLCNNLKLN